MRLGDLQSGVAEDSGLAGTWRCVVGRVVPRFPSIVVPSSSGSSGLTLEMKMLRSLRTNSVQVNTGYWAQERWWWKNFEIWIALNLISSIHACRWVKLDLFDSVDTLNCYHWQADRVFRVDFHKDAQFAAGRWREGTHLVSPCIWMCSWTAERIFVKFGV